jgi:hypothetical protein
MTATPSRLASSKLPEILAERDVAPDAKVWMV